ncbi:MAG: SURF1 family protein [Rhizobiales bacterium]|nr:SURF1 family protein [Hyphomicrobiales bacterium]
MTAARRSLVGPAIVVLAATALLVWLGVWQMRRLAWKETLLAHMEARLAAPAGPLPAPAQWPQLRPDDYEFRHVRVAGVYEPQAQALVFAGAVSLDKGPARPGYYVMTPLRLADGAALLVNRGFLPIDLADAARRGPPPPAGLQTVTGHMRAPEGRNAFTPADKPEKGEFFARDPAALGAANKISLAPFTLDAEANGATDWPRGGATVERAPNNHLSYALTWFGLAATLVVFFLVWALRTGRREG